MATDNTVILIGNLTDDPEVRSTEGRIARARFRVAVGGRGEQEVSFFTVVVRRDQADHAAGSLSKGSRVVVVGRLQQRTWTAEDGSARAAVEVVAEELGPSLRWATVTHDQGDEDQQPVASARITRLGGRQLTLLGRYLAPDGCLSRSQEGLP
jgi:single-strand DNA-binding protein